MKWPALVGLGGLWRHCPTIPEFPCQQKHHIANSYCTSIYRKALQSDRITFLYDALNVNPSS